MYKESIWFKMLPVAVGIVVLILFTSFCKGCNADEIPWSNVEIVHAVYMAEGGANAQYLYGIRSVKYMSVAEAQQICFRTVRHARKDYYATKQTGDFIEFLGRRYCPIGAKNDPRGYNKYWVKNVHFFLANRNK